MIRTHIRKLHSSSPRQNLFDFFRRTKVSEPVAPKVPVKKTKQVMQELAESDSSSTKPVKLRVLASPPDPEIVWNKQKDGFAVNPWPTRYNDASLTCAQVDAAINSAYQKSFQSKPETDILSTPLDDLQTRFNFIKAVSKELNIAIPDRILSTASTVSVISTYLREKVVGIKFDEKNPEAIYLDSSDFEGLNVSIVDKRDQIKKERKRFEQAYRDAQRLEKERQRALLDEALN